MRRFVIPFAVVLALASACGSSGSSGKSTSRATTITLVTHDSFAVSKAVLTDFTKRTGVKVKVVASGDAGAALNQVILTKSHPLGDAFFGVDNTLLSRAVNAGIFERYRSPELSHVPTQYQLASGNELTPVDHGDVCVNFDRAELAKRKLPAPRTLSDLAKPIYKDLLVAENPATSSPGLAFVLATIAKFGTRGWQHYWSTLRANGLKVAAGWDQAYNGDFSAGPGHGDRPLVVSYATSPPASVDPNTKPLPAQAPVGTALDTCYKQIEFVGVLRGTQHAAAARQLVDEMLSTRFQQDMPLQMYVLPVRDGAKLPELFVKYADQPKHSFQLPSATVERNRETWIGQWTDRVIG